MGIQRRTIITLAICVLAGAVTKTAQSQVVRCNGGGSGSGYGPSDVENCIEAGDCGTGGSGCCLHWTCVGHPPHCSQNVTQLCTTAYSCSDLPPTACGSDCSAGAAVSPEGSKAAFQQARPPVTSITVTPFTMEIEIISFVHHAQGELHRKQTIALRSDGSRSTTQTILGKAGLDAGETSRTIRFINGQAVTAFPSLGVKNTWPALVPAAVEQVKAGMLHPAPNCVRPGYVLQGTDTMQGEPVSVVTYTTEDAALKVTRWEAPQLACETLKYDTYEKQQDGSYKLQIESRAVRLSFGEPDPALFEEPVGMREMKPSEVVGMLADKYHLVLDKLQKETIDLYDKGYQQGAPAVSRLRGPQLH